MISVYHLLHVTGVILLVGLTFQSCADPDPGKKRFRMILAGLASFITLLGGFGLLARMGLGFPGWVIIKLVCWLGISALSGLAYRCPEKAGKLTLATAALVLVAVYCVYFLNPINHTL